MLHVNSTQMVTVAVKVDEIARDSMQNKNMIDQRAGFPCGSAGKDHLTCNAGDLGLIPGLGRSPGEGKGYPLKYSGLENSMDSPWGCKEPDTTEQLSLPFTSVRGQNPGEH